jgi:hypothetical protein
VLGFPTGALDSLLALAFALGLFKAGALPLGLFVASTFAGRHATQVTVVVNRGGRSGSSNEESGSGNEGKEGSFHDS